MAGRNMAANLGMNIDWRLKDPGMFNRGIENFSRPDADPTNMEQMQGLLNWQQQMGREDAARTTLAQVEKLKAEQTTSRNLEAAKKAASIRNTMDVLARHDMPEDKREIAMSGLQAQLDALSVTEDQVRANSGYKQRTTNAATQEATARSQEARAAAEAERAEERSRIARDEAARIKLSREAAAEYALAQTDEERESIRSREDYKPFAPDLRRMDSERLQLEALEAQANNARVEMNEAPDYSEFKGQELSPAANKLMSQVEKLAEGYNEETGKWDSQVDRQRYNKAVDNLLAEQVGELRRETQRIAELDADLEQKSLALQLQAGVPDPRAVQAQVESAAGSLGYDAKDLNELDEDEYKEVMDLAKKRATVLHNETVYASLSNVRMAQDPTQISEKEISKANGGEFEGERGRVHFDEFRRKYIARLRGREPGGQQETLAAYRKFNEAAKQRKAEEISPAQASGSSLLNPTGASSYSELRSGREALGGIIDSVFDPLNDRMSNYTRRKSEMWEENSNR